MSALSEEQFAIAALRTKLREAEAENARLVKERDAAIKTCEMASTSGAFWARRAEAAEARAAELERKVGDLTAELRCHATKNPCGTDTWMVVAACPCAACRLAYPDAKRATQEVTLGLRAAALCEPEGGA